MAAQKLSVAEGYEEEYLMLKDLRVSLEEVEEEGAFSLCLWIYLLNSTRSPATIIRQVFIPRLFLTIYNTFDGEINTHFPICHIFVYFCLNHHQFQYPVVAAAVHPFFKFFFLSFPIGSGEIEALPFLFGAHLQISHYFL